ncbi:MAG TPA: CHAP domain-containing protein [Candidatus Acidoferrales bacterium]|nr:CHAP domain-containing protein [Candidatus Acidoferrales bacterium]
MTRALVLVLACVVSVGAVAGATEAAATPPVPLFASVPAGGYPDPFPYGECTYWVAYNVPVSWGGDAKDWLEGARAAGAEVADTPSVGAVAVFTPGGAYSELGHVAVVVAVSATGYRVSEMHAPDLGVVREREIAWPDAHVAGFILPRGAP